MPPTSPFVSILVTIQAGLFLGMVFALIWGLRELQFGRSLLPSGSARDVPWKGLDVLGVLFLFVVVSRFVGGAILPEKKNDLSEPAKPAANTSTKDATATPPKNAEPAPQSFVGTMLAMTCINTIVLVLVPPVLRVSSGANLEQIGISSKNLARNIQLGIRTFLFATPFVYVIFILAQLIWRPNKHPLELMMMKEMSPGVMALAVVSAVIVAPLAEELLFRSVLQGWLTRWLRARFRPRPEISLQPNEPNGFWEGTLNFYEAPQGLTPRGEAEVTAPVDRRPEMLAVMITSAVFALLHAPQMPAPVPLFALSMILGLLMQRTGSLVPSLVVHALFNGLSTIGLLIRSLSSES